MVLTARTSSARQAFEKYLLTDNMKGVIMLM